MPAYEYLCEECGDHFERRQKMSDPEVDACPACGGHVKRLISAGVGVISKGAGGFAAPAGGCEGGECGTGTCCGGVCGYEN
ncbi:MAG TPA: zinc ribbon domain-containing protein [Terracidiphilus sp.]|nr:zinc ribbon domain-containing protein [Terracidiphilus sp.]